MDPITIGLLASTALGTGLSIFGQIKGASAQAEAQARQADAKRFQAAELLQRQEINERIMREQAEFQERFAGMRSRGTTNTGLGDVLRIRRDLESNLLTSRREAEFKAKMLRMGADVETQLASDLKTAGWLSSGGTLLTSAASTYNIMRGPSKPDSLR